jgi:hypothetical protein
MEKEIPAEIMETIKELIKLDPDFQNNLKLLLKLRKEKPYMYTLAILKLRAS